MQAVLNAIENRLNDNQVQEIIDELVNLNLMIQELSNKKMKMKEELSAIDMINPFSQKEEKKEAKRLKKKIKKMEEKYIKKTKRIGKLYVKTAMTILPIRLKFAMIDIDKSIGSLSATATNALGMRDGIFAPARIDGIGQLKKDLLKLNDILIEEYRELYDLCPEAKEMYNYVISTHLDAHDLPQIPF